jgi:cellulose synthase/poly-beta-1,6-N-acetylglucosamine synthase-like glycosyltransferase
MQAFPVKLLRESKPGPSAARNAGLAVAQGEIIVCLDADTLPTRRWLAELLKPFDNPQVLIVGGTILTYNPQTAAERYCDSSGIYNPQHNVRAQVFPFAAGMNMAARAQALKEVGGWDETFKWGEDIDVSHRILQRHPGTLAHAERAMMFHRNRSTLNALSRQAFGYGRGAAIVYRRFPETAQWRIRNSITLSACVLGRWLYAGVAALARALRLMEAPRAELCYCHALWGWSFCRGFLIEYYWVGTESKTRWK